jgi:hypothetical protein
MIGSTGSEPRPPDWSGHEVEDCSPDGWLTCFAICCLSAIVTIVLLILAIRSVVRFFSA